ncbi:MAG: hypothetical protein A2270_10320 [Elusimicrobia bacterium RIFOXYA12_FULL_51_18]|nr:MAG: hypothetical protein A2270_10320 [Elusimicrobia bacterium RIFOXYA12_FULL_51_18]OGS29541.1 MAG: hypothetical protein A2218_00870 [Elusimicrobia bacterium RIFOXYA2_FULL_53_38]
MEKRTAEPFKFCTRLTLTEVTGRKAFNIAELLEGIKAADDATIYHHTHRFIKQSHHLVPEGANDFAYWVTRTVQADRLGEQLTSIDIVQFNSLADLKAAFVKMLERHIAENPEQIRTVAPGREFHFMRAIRFSLPTECAASDYAGFIQCLRNVSVSSLYLHVFEARLRPPYGVDDFSHWFKTNFNDEIIGKEISRLDPYSYTLESLRQRIIRIVEHRLAEVSHA